MRRQWQAVRGLIVAIVVVWSIREVAADDKPWSAGVPADRQQQALALYKDGNQFFEQDQFKEALVRYEKALVLWDHPAIRYNAAICLINLDRPAEAYEHLIAAMRFGEAPLGADLYKQGQSYEKLLARQVATLEVRCSEPGAQVSLDGKSLFHGPDSARRYVPAVDAHQIVAAKPGYQTETRLIKLAPGKTTTLVIELRLLGTAKRRVNPWFVVIGGAIVASASVPLWLGARSSYQAYDARVASACPGGCLDSDLPAAARALESHARLENALAIGALAVGSAGVVGGLALRYLTRPHRGAPTVVPAVGTDHLGLVISGRW
jgi:tetratricopeptide (TPR) repeat protein